MFQPFDTPENSVNHGRQKLSKCFCSCFVLNEQIRQFGAMGSRFDLVEGQRDGLACRLVGASTDDLTRTASRLSDFGFFIGF
jgi:hypothetical protein